ncbi:MAG: type II toxin-antitoxin system HipA family toxin [Spirochaetota bacterium]
MSTIAEVQLWGRTIGAVSLTGESPYAVFQYDPAFAQSGIEISPVCMPLSRRVYTFPDLPLPTFHGLPGLLADSLPDKFGNALINVWLARQGRTPESFNAVERLCYTGSRGMGALEFKPAYKDTLTRSEKIEIEELTDLASEVLSSRNDWTASLADADREKALHDILCVGTSAGGARAKAVIAWNPVTSEVRSGQIKTDPQFEYWLLKFDGVKGNRDKERVDHRGYGALEYAYSRMAHAAGITMSECRMFEEKDRHHFMTRRFDRLPGGGKIHMQSLCALAHYDFNQARAYSYEQAFSVIRRLDLPAQSVEEQYRRMTFNIMARNQDDHVKNIAFLMDKTGRWSLAPAYDITYSFNPNGSWTSKHQMSMNGKSDGFTLTDFRECAKHALMKRGRADSIIDEVRTAVREWRNFADDAHIEPSWRDVIQKNLRLQFPE